MLTKINIFQEFLPQIVQILKAANDVVHFSAVKSWT